MDVGTILFLTKHDMNLSYSTLSKVTTQKLRSEFDKTAVYKQPLPPKQHTLQSDKMHLEKIQTVFFQLQEQRGRMKALPLTELS